MGYLVYEKYFGKGNREAHPEYGLDRRKAFTSISCGILLKEKREQIPEGPRDQGLHRKVPA